MKSRKNFCFMVVLLLLITVLSACSQETPPAEAPNVEGPAEEPAQEPKQPEYPTKNITLINPYAAGGGTDIVARALAQELETRLGKSVVVVNKVGGSGSIGTSEAAKADPDGYTIFMNDKAYISSYYLGVSDVKYDDMDPVSRLDAASLAIVVNSNSPYKTPAEFVKAAKENPGTLTVAVSGIGGMTHLLAENFKMAADIDVKIVSYEGGGETRAALAGEHVDAISAQLGEIYSFVEAGDFEILAIADAERHPDFPDVPTFKESDVDFELNQWRAVWVPKGTPEDIIDKLAETIKECMESESMKKLMADTFTQNLYLGPDELKVELDTQDELLEKLVTDSGLLNR